MRDARFWIESLGLSPHPEGGFFRETYRCDEEVPAGFLRGREQGARSFATAIYFLLPGTMVSAFHVLKSDESWFFHDGAPLTIHLITPGGEYRKQVLGRDPLLGQNLQVHIPRGTWFGASVNDHGSFSLMSCTVSPGFDFSDFRLGTREDLTAQFPGHRKIIEYLTP